MKSIDLGFSLFIVSAAWFANVNNNGNSNNNNASNAAGGVRPIHCLYIFGVSFRSTGKGKERKSFQVKSLINANRHAVGYD